MKINKRMIILKPFWIVEDIFECFGFIKTRNKIEEIEDKIYDNFYYRFKWFRV